MRELAKSMMSYTWAMSMFGVQQAINLVTPVQGTGQSAKTSQAFDNVTEATAQTFDPTMVQAFKTGVSLQIGMIDMMFGGFLAGGCDPTRLMRMGSDAMQTMSGMGQQAQGAGSNSNSAPSGSASCPSNWGSMPR
jgi:hypothetical protein